MNAARQIRRMEGIQTAEDTKAYVLCTTEMPMNLQRPPTTCRQSGSRRYSLGFSRRNVRNILGIRLLKAPDC